VARLHALLNEPGLLVGSLVRMRRRCGGAGCRCRQGHLHASWYLAIRVGRRRRLIYLPAAWEAPVRAWVARGQAVRQGLQIVSRFTLRRFLAQRQAE